MDPEQRAVPLEEKITPTLGQLRSMADPADEEFIFFTPGEGDEPPPGPRRGSLMLMGMGR